MNLEHLFNKQLRNQIEMLNKGTYDNFKISGTDSVPVDDVKLMSYHVQQLISEVGEVLSADKRWKNFRNDKINEEEKLEEIADCFIVLMNIAMFSNINAEELGQAINDKLDKVWTRIRKE